VRLFDRAIRTAAVLIFFEKHFVKTSRKKASRANNDENYKKKLNVHFNEIVGKVTNLFSIILARLQ
jgi:hypothetical protein